MSKQRSTICIEGWYYLVVLGFIIAGAVIRQINLLMFVAGIMIGPLILSWRLAARTLKRLEVRRSLPKGIGAGELLVVDLRVDNGRRRLPTWGLIVEDTIAREDGPRWKTVEAIRLFLPHIAAGQSAELTYQGRLPQRGRYRLGPIRLTSRFPLGLVRRTVVLDRTGELFVYPRLGRLTMAWLKIAQQGRVGSRRSEHRRGLVEGEFHGLRDWRGGDSRRWIHWRTSARRNVLTVLQFERQENQDTALLLDLWQPGESSVAGLESLERAISFAGTVVAHQCRRGSCRMLLGLGSNPSVLVDGVTSMGLLQEAMEKLAVAHRSTEDRLPQLLATTLDQIPPDTRVVIISTQRTDLSDTERFESVWNDPRKRGTIGKIICLETGQPEFEACFDRLEGE